MTADISSLSFDWASHQKAWQITKHLSILILPFNQQGLSKVIYFAAIALSPTRQEFTMRKSKSNTLCVKYLFKMWLYSNRKTFSHPQLDLTDPCFCNLSFSNWLYLNFCDIFILNWTKKYLNCFFFF